MAAKQITLLVLGLITVPLVNCLIHLLSKPQKQEEATVQLKHMVTLAVLRTIRMRSRQINVPAGII